MGWGRMLLLGNWGQQMDIEDQKLEIDELRRQLRSQSGPDITQENRLSQLEKDNAELRLYLASIIKYLGQKGILRESELRRIVEMIDSEDGNTDNAYRGDIIT